MNRLIVLRIVVCAMLILSGKGQSLLAQMDTTPPGIIKVAFEGTPLKTDPEVIYRVSFSEPVDSVSIDDFQADLVSGFAEGTITMAVVDSTVNSDYLIAVQIEGSLYNVKSDQQLKLQLSDDHNIHDLAGNKLSAFDNSTIPFHTTQLSYFDHPGAFRFVLEEDDLPEDSPLQLTPQSIGLLIPGLRSYWPSNEALRVEIKLDSFFLMQDFYTGSENQGWKSAYSISIYGPDINDTEKAFKAVEFKGVFEMTGSVQFNYDPDNPVSIRNTDQYVFSISSFNFKDTELVESNIGQVNIFLLEFRLNLASIGLVTALHPRIKSLSYPALPLQLNEIGFHEDYPDSVKYMEFYDGGLGNIIVGAGALSGMETQRGFLRGYLERHDPDGSAWHSRTNAKLIDEFYPNNFITTDEQGYFVVDNPDMLSLQQNIEDVDPDNTNNYVIGFEFNGSDISISEHEDYSIPQRPTGARPYSLQRYNTDGRVRNRVEEWAYGFPTKGKDNSVFLVGDTLVLSENISAVLDIGAHAGGLATFEESESYTITGGADQALFEINATTGLLNFKTAPDFENPLDTDQNNEYLVEITADRSPDYMDSDVLEMVIEITDVDDIAPTIMITSDAADPQSGPFTATFTFSEAVIGFELSDITVGNGTADNFESLGSTVYSTQITPATDGTVTVDVAAGLVSDAAGNVNPAAAQLSVTNDETAPSITITSDATDPQSGPFKATFTFSEAVTGFELSEITVGNGTADNFESFGSTVYAAQINPASDGTVTVDVAAGLVSDAAGNVNPAAAQLSVTNDETAPSITITSDATDPQSGPFTATLTFSEAVTGFELSDITVGNGSADNFESFGSKVYAAQITPATDETVTVDVAAGKVSDAAGNVNPAATQLSVTNDETAPSITITSDAADPQSGPFTATFTFSEAVTGFELSDITVGNGTADNFESFGSTIYAAQITPASDGTVTVDVAAGLVSDAAGNANTGATQLAVTNDETAPEVTAIAKLSNNPVPTGTTELQFEIIFSEVVTDFSTADLQIDLTETATASFGAITANSNASYEVSLSSLSGEGAIGLTVKTGGTLTDQAGNPLASAFTSQVYTTNYLPTDIDLNTATITENNALDDVIGTFITTDRDAHTTFVYSLVAGVGGDDNASFSIVNDQLLAAETFDFERQTSYSIRVQSTDELVGSYEEAFTINIDNVLEGFIILEGDLDFDLSALGITQSRELRMSNNGEKAVAVSVVDIPGGFTMSPGSAIVDVGATETIMVNFTPTEARTYSGTLLAVYENGTAQIDVSGEGAIITMIDQGQWSKNLVKVYPNPTSQTLSVDLSQLAAPRPNVYLLDGLGKPVFTKAAVTASTLQIDVSDFQSGLYLLQVSDGQHIITRKVMIKN